MFIIKFNSAISCSRFAVLQLPLEQVWGSSWGFDSTEFGLAPGCSAVRSTTVIAKRLDRVDCWVVGLVVYHSEAGSPWLTSLHQSPVTSMPRLLA